MKRNTSAVLEALRLACNDEGRAVEFFERHRWSDSPACPRCGDVNVYQMTGKDGGRNKDYRWRCRGCKRMHSVRTGTVLEETRLPLRHWAFALWSACSNKKGVSALQISRECEISYKSALFLMHRIRRGMKTDGPRPKLTGTIEADETFVGGRPRERSEKKGPKAPKAPVLGIVERGGQVRLHALDRLSAATIREAIVSQVDLGSSRLMTDESGAYTKVGREFAGGHETTEHSWREYARPGGIHSNTVEGVFSLLKRGVMGTYHSLSKKHLHRYVAEFEFRYNARKMNDGERVALAVRAIEGKRLTYAEQIGRSGSAG
jgi:transposase-like protein